MSWEQPAYSFGNPNAQPPTPTKTPTSATFPSPFQTPQNNRGSFDQSGWTPTFAEEYSVFNATPGRLISTHLPFAETPKPAESSSKSQEEIAADIASHVNHTVQTSLPLPPVDLSRQLSSSPSTTPTYAGGFGDRSKTTPRKPRRRLEEAFGAQTATPPLSAAKVSRRLAPKIGTPTMNRDEDPLNLFDTPLQQHALDFSNMGDMFSYPMSAPATAPVFGHARFWDTDASMSGMDMSFSQAESGMGMLDGHKISSSFDWARNNQMFQESNIQPFTDDSQDTPTARRPRAIASKPPSLAPTPTNFAFSGPGDDPFAIAASTGAVDPGLLFTFPPQSTANMHEERTSTPPSRPATSHQPYQHQQRESLRDQEELLRNRAMRGDSTMLRYEKPSQSSPAKLSRPGLSRSASESRAKRPAQRNTSLSSLGSGSRPSSSTSNIGRLSPAKQLNRLGLASIPEVRPSSHASVSFRIDEHGRAHTDTAIIIDEPRTIKGGPSSSLSGREDYTSSESDESSTDEDIIVTSRNSSFVAPNQQRESRSSKPRPLSGSFSGKRTRKREVSGRRSSMGIGPSRSSTSSSSINDQDSEAETVMDEGDAAKALQRVMMKRAAPNQGQAPGNMAIASGGLYRSQFRGSSAQIAGQSGRGSGIQLRNSSFGGQLNYANMGTPTRDGRLSPSTMTDPDLTPSTERSLGGMSGSDRSEGTRCVCGNGDGDQFMIQCESCLKWLHANCVGIIAMRIPKVYICAFCAQTPNMRGGRIRDTARDGGRGQQLFLGSSPLAGKGGGWR